MDPFETLRALGRAVGQDFTSRSESRKLPGSTGFRPIAERRAARLKSLTTLTEQSQVGDVLAALTSLWQDGHSPERITFRYGFSRLATEATGPWNDRKLPPLPQRPPATRLVPSELAMRFYLTGIFVAQCESPPGSLGPRDRPLGRDQGVSSSTITWSDLIAVPAVHKSSRTKGNVFVNRRRQLGNALDRLAHNEVRLALLPNGADTRGKHEHFQLLSDDGPVGLATRSRYTVPKVNEIVFSVPRAFFDHGWHLALTPSEISMLFAVWSHSTLSRGATTGPVSFDGDERIGRMGLSPDALATHKTLQAFGVLHVHVPPTRRADGTVVDQRVGEPLPLHEFLVDESGFEKNAVGIVSAVLKGM